MKHTTAFAHWFGSLALIMCCSFAAEATKPIKDSSPPSQISEEKPQDIKKDAAKAKESEQALAEDHSSFAMRDQMQHSLIGTYSPFDLWVPSKLGVSYAFNKSASGSWEVEYLKGSVAFPFIVEELGSITDQRISLFYRSFSDRNSFSYLYGVNYSSLKIQLGTDLLATILTGDPSSFDVISVKTLGLTWGFGNRWQWDHFLIGLDWFTLNIPVYTIEADAPFINATSSESKKDDAQEVLDFAKRIPTLAVLKIQLGISF